jgi:hypothetical protein
VRVFEYNRYTTSEDEIKALITSDIESIAVVWNFHHSYVIPLFERTFSDYSVNELDEEGLGSLTFGDVTVKEGK